MAREKSGTRGKGASRSKAMASGRKAAVSKKPAADPKAEPVAAASSAAPASPATSPTAADAPALSAAGPAPAILADPPVPFDEDGLKRVQDIIRNARATWFALLGALVFAAITLASVRDVAFFVSSVETKLPVVGISVPVYSFFWAGSLLIAALYAYFHLYLELLWQALGDAPARINGKPLADRIDPWIVTDAALRLRDRLRGAHGEARASRKRAMQSVSDIVSFGLVWFFGLAVIFWFWWRSMPAHDPLLTGFIGAVFAFTLWVFCKGITDAVAHLADREARWHWKSFFAFALAVVVALTVVRTWVDPWEGSQRVDFQSICHDQRFDQRGLSGKLRDICWEQFTITKEFFRPARADLRGGIFASKPTGWVSLDDAKIALRADWCKELEKGKCANPLAIGDNSFDEDQEVAFQSAWETRRKALIYSLERPRMLAMDLRGANLAIAQLEGVLLSFARLEGANIEGARLQESGLTGAQLSRANLLLARLEGARLVDANLERAYLVFANLEGADLTSARVFGTAEKPLDLNDTKLDRSQWTNAGLRFAKLSTIDTRKLREFDKSFGDASVELADGAVRPARWCKSKLSDEQFFGRWRGWIEHTWGPRSGAMFNNFPAISPAEPCPELTGSMSETKPFGMQEATP